MWGWVGGGIFENLFLMLKPWKVGLGGVMGLLKRPITGKAYGVISSLERVDGLAMLSNNFYILHKKSK